MPCCMSLVGTILPSGGVERMAARGSILPFAAPSTKVGRGRERSAPDRHHISMSSAIASASSSSMPRYRTVLSIFVWPRRSCTALRLPVSVPRCGPCSRLVDSDGSTAGLIWTWWLPPNHPARPHRQRLAGSTTIADRMSRSSMTAPDPRQSFRQDETVRGRIDVPLEATRSELRAIALAWKTDSFPTVGRRHANRHETARRTAQCYRSDQ